MPLPVCKDRTRTMRARCYISQPPKMPAASVMRRVGRSSNRSKTKRHFQNPSPIKFEAVLSSERLISLRQRSRSLAVRVSQRDDTWITENRRISFVLWPHLSLSLSLSFSISVFCRERSQRCKILMTFPKHFWWAQQMPL